MPSGLSWLAQEDFSAGAIRSVARHLIPRNGAYTLLNALLDDDGSVYRRGGSEYVSTAFGSRLTWLWSGHLAAGPRTVFHTGTALGVLAANDVTPINLGASTDASLGHSAVVNGMLFMPYGYVYGGSRLTGPHSAGTVALTNGSRVVTGAGTGWSAANVDAGMLLAFTPAGDRFYVVESVDYGAQQIVLADPWEGSTGAGATYTAVPVGSAVGSGYRIASSYATAAERLVTIEGSRIYFSRGRSELGVLQPHVFDETDFHELPEAALGLGAAAIRDLLVVFATDGIWTISNMAFDLTDAAGNVQQQMQRTAQNIVLWGTGGVAEYRGALVVAATDGVYLVDGVSPPVPVAESIAPILDSHVLYGRSPGVAAVHKNHYVLPVRESDGSKVDLLVCRLDRPVRVRSRTFFPWTWFDGHGGDVNAVASRVAVGSAGPRLLGAGDSDSRVLDLTGAFAPSEAGMTDADGTAHTFVLVTRDYPTGSGNVNTVRRVRVRYELARVGGVATIAGGYATGTYSLAFTALTPDAPEDDGTGRHTWLLQADARHFRVMLSSTDPAARLTLRSVEIAVRQSGKDR